MKPGDVISRYEIVDRLGAGGFGVVYRAIDTRLRRPVALKFLPQGSFSETDKQRFMNEARAAAQAHHPNICPIHDIEEADGEVFIVMACLEGETLERKTKRGPLDPVQAVSIAAQVASGLACAHGLGIVHRDIKSANIMVDDNGLASIMDFGLAISSDAMRVTNAGISVGTPAYMSPEQAQGRNVDSRTDIWSLGVVMFEMLTGSLPFRRDDYPAVLHAIVYDPLPALSTLRPGVAPELETIVAKALAKDPSARWQTAAQLAAALRRQEGGSGAISDSEMHATRTIPVAISRWEPTTRKRIGMIGAAALAVALCGFALYRYQPWRRSPPAVSIAAVKQVAVLPFQVDGASGETRAIADGMVEILATAISDLKCAGCNIAAVPVSDLRRRKIATVEAAQRFYGVNLAITGTARTAGDTVELNLNVVDTAKKQTIASRTILYDPKNPLVSRDQAITQVIRMLNVDVPDGARTSIAPGDTPKPDAFSAYIEGRGLLSRYDVSGNVDRAVAKFTHATEQDPKYALAYAGLGEAYWRKARATGDKKWVTLANQNAEYAVHLDGNLAIARSVLGSVYLDAGRQDDAIREFERAMELAAGNAEAPRQLAEVYNNLGRFKEAEALYIQSRNARPTDWYGHLLLGLFYYERERYEEAIVELTEAKSLTPDNDLVRRNLGTVYQLCGRYQESINEYREALRIRSNAGTYAALGGSLYYLHRFPEAVAAAEAAIDLDSNDYRYWGNLGIYYHWAPGHETKAPTALRRAIELASKFAEARKNDYGIRADLAEYRARLGDGKGAVAEIGRIPEASRAPLAARLAIAYELSGHRDKAIAVVRSNLKSSASLNQIKDDPDLASLWREVQSR